MLKITTHIANNFNNTAWNVDLYRYCENWKITKKVHWQTGQCVYHFFDGSKIVVSGSKWTIEA